MMKILMLPVVVSIRSEALWHFVVFGTTVLMTKLCRTCIAIGLLYHALSVSRCHMTNRVVQAVLEFGATIRDSLQENKIHNSRHQLEHRKTSCHNYKQLGTWTWKSIKITVGCWKLSLSFCRFPFGLGNLGTFSSKFWSKAGSNHTRRSKTFPAPGHFLD